MAGAYSLLSGVLILCAHQLVSSVSVPPLQELHGSAFYEEGLDERLLDWSYAGYAAGEAPIPGLKPSHNVVTDFGAKGDGDSDDSDAFIRAIHEMPDGGVLLIPPGRYVITKQLLISRKQLSFKGAGAHHTTLLLPKSVAEVLGLPEEDAEQGMITVEGVPFYEDPGKWLATITQPAKRGDTILRVSCVACANGDIKPGHWISVTQGAPDPSAPDRYNDMNMGTDQGCYDDTYCFIKDDFAYTLQTRVSRVINDSAIELERALPWNMTAIHQPWAVWRWAPDTAGIGFEGFTMVWTNAPMYKGHFNETSLNSIQLRHVANSWIQDVRIINADLGINIHRSSFLTITDIGFGASSTRPDADGIVGHHGLVVKWASVDVLVTRFVFGISFLHDITVDIWARGIVFSRGGGVDLAVDCHRGESYGILYTQLHAGRGTRPWKSGGRPNRGTFCGTFTTFWNLQSTTAEHCQPKKDQGPYLNYIGAKMPNVTANMTVSLQPTWYINNIPPAQLRPPNLYEAQRKWRLAHQDKAKTRMLATGRVRGKLGKAQGGAGHGRKHLRVKPRSVKGLGGGEGTRYAGTHDSGWRV